MDMQKKSTLRKFIEKSVVAGIIVMVAAGGYFFFLRNGAETPAKYETAAVKRGDITAKITATGTLSALVTVNVGSQVSGRLEKISADYNSVVKKGQVLARIDPQFFIAAVEQSEANLIAAESGLEKAKIQASDAERTLRRTEQLVEKELVSQADIDTVRMNRDLAVVQVRSAEGTVAQVKAALRQARINLDYTTILSPINGIVISRSVDVGQTVAASFQAPTLFTIAEDLRRMQVDTNVSESDVGKLAAGLRAEFTVDAYPGERFTGTVRQVRNAAQTVSNVVTYDAVIDVGNPELKLKPGMTASVEFIYAERAGALTIPNAALRFRPAGEQSPKRTGKTRELWVLREGCPVVVAVTVGISDGSVTEISADDIHEDDAVITGVATTGKGAAKEKGGKLIFGGPPPR